MKHQRAPGSDARPYEQRRKNAERKKSFWARIFSPKESAREHRALQYIVHRINEGGRLEEIVEEEYVRRTVSRDQIDDFLSDLRIVEAQQKMEEDFDSGELDPPGSRQQS